MMEKIKKLRKRRTGKKNTRKKIKRIATTLKEKYNITFKKKSKMKERKKNNEQG